MRCGCILNVDGKAVYPYRCPHCGQCLFHAHESFYHDGKWYWRGPCGTHPA
jgi:hypothetical protein